MSWLFIIFSIYLGLHLFIYLSIVYFFELSQESKLKLGLILVFLLLSFIVSSILSRWNDFFLINYYYVFSSFWIGFAINLSLFLLGAWMLLGISKLFSTDIRTLLGVSAFLVALFYSFYGVWKARNPIVKELEVEIKDLPREWRGKKIVQISDVHLGKIQGEKFADKIVEIVNGLNGEIIFITGDLIDGMAVGVSDYAQIINQLKSKQGTYFVTGNHEIYLGKAKAIEALQETDIKLLENEAVQLNGLQIIGLGFNNFGQVRKKGTLKQLNNFKKGRPSILLYHTPVSIIEENDDASFQHSSLYWFPKIDFSEAKNNGVRLQLSGHTHNGQLFPFNFLTHFIYKGFDYGLHKDGDFSIYITSGAGTWGPPMRTWGNSEIVLITLK
ncbi:MAG: hypothetical protein GF347_02025 [Candidatus Moranbacteria bacterium]|nr:hypothetical protein [Candidatus Moranbacteria bacterium]